MLSALYSGLWRVVSPVIRHYLRRRGRKNAAYLAHWDERFGVPYPQPVRDAIWIHAVSVGETRAAQPIIAALRQRFPDAPLLITQMTPTGRATAQSLYPDAQCRYLPYDHPDWVAQFMREHRPCVGIIMETELWVNLLQAACVASVPMFVVNARLSDKSARGYAKIASLLRPALQTLRGCLAQTADDARRLQQLGAANVQVCGNSKYDITPPNQAHDLARQFRERIGKRRVFLVASTREKEGMDEAWLVLQAWEKWRQVDDLLVIVPRHPERFEAACTFAQEMGLTVQKRSDNQPIDADTQVWVGDSMGEMFAYYLVADVVFVGGSLVDTGCQNIIEPMTCGKPVLFGQSVYNFQAACDGALQFGAAKQIRDADELGQTVRQWLDNPENYAEMTARAQQFVAQHQGASARIAQQIIDKLKGA